jgi:hypothetical protein
MVVVLSAKLISRVIGKKAAAAAGRKTIAVLSPPHAPVEGSAANSGSAVELSPGSIVSSSKGITPESSRGSIALGEDVVAHGKDAYALLVRKAHDLLLGHLHRLQTQNSNIYDEQSETNKRLNKPYSTT